MFAGFMPKLPLSLRYLMRQPPATPAEGEPQASAPAQRWAHGAVRAGLALGAQRLVERNVDLAELRDADLAQTIRTGIDAVSALMSPLAVAGVVVTRALTPLAPASLPTWALTLTSTPRYVARALAASWQHLVNGVPGATLAFYFTHAGYVNPPAACTSPGPPPEGLICPDPVVQASGDRGEPYVAATAIALLGLAVGLAIYQRYGGAWRAAARHEVPGPPPGHPARTPTPALPPPAAPPESPAAAHARRAHQRQQTAAAAETRLQHGAYAPLPACPAPADPEAQHGFVPRPSLAARVRRLLHVAA